MTLPLLVVPGSLSPRTTAFACGGAKRTTRDTALPLPLPMSLRPPPPLSLRLLLPPPSLLAEIGACTI